MSVISAAFMAFGRSCQREKKKERSVRKTSISSPVKGRKGHVFVKYDRKLHLFGYLIKESKLVAGCRFMFQ